jgi:hypothetical protein
MERAMAKARARAKERMPGFAESARFDLLSPIHSILYMFYHKVIYLSLDLLSWIFDEFSGTLQVAKSTLLSRCEISAQIRG